MRATARTKLAIVVLLAIFSLGASCGGPRHVGYVGLVSIHSVVGLVQDTEARLVCGRVGAPQSPQCIPYPKHQQIRAMIKDALEMERAAGEILLTLPQDKPQPTEVIILTVKINALIQKIISMFPEGPAKQAMVENIGGVK
jgi:hypothetical protein